MRAQVSKNFDLFDQALFRAALERIVQEGELPAEDLQTVQVFQEAWSKSDRDRD